MKERKLGRNPTQNLLKFFLIIKNNRNVVEVIFSIAPLWGEQNIQIKF